MTETLLTRVFILGILALVISQRESYKINFSSKPFVKCVSHKYLVN